MELQEPPPDPFAGMTPEERKRAQEMTIVEMVFNPDEFAEVTPGERPDFTLRRTLASLPFGVEVTQLFPNESLARLNLVHGYHHRLWSGRPHLHRDDQEVLHSVKVQIRDPEGNVKATDIPAVIVETTDDGFIAGLNRTLAAKAAKAYDQPDLSHIDLVVLDWYRAKFDPADYFTSRFFDQDTRRLLRKSPFREIHLVVAATEETNDPVAPLEHEVYRVVPLQLLLIFDHVFVTGHMIDEEYRGQIRDTDHLNDLVLDHVSRVQGVGVPVVHDGHHYLRYRSILIRIRTTGTEVLTYMDMQVPDYQTAELFDRMPHDVERRVTERAAENVLGLGMASRARNPRSWLSNDTFVGHGTSDTLQTLSDQEGWPAAQVAGRPDQSRAAEGPASVGVPGPPGQRRTAGRQRDRRLA